MSGENEYFKPKKMSKDGLEFRPLHTTDLITQIAIVAMLHLFVYINVYSLIGHCFFAYYGL